MTTYLGKSCSFGLLRVPFVNCRQFMYLVYFPFGFEGRMWDLIVSVPDHCLSFYLAYPGYIKQINIRLFYMHVHMILQSDFNNGQWSRSSLKKTRKKRTEYDIGKVTVRNVYFSRELDDRLSKLHIHY